MLERESMRDLGKSIDYLLIFVSQWTSGDWCAHLSLSLSLSVYIYIYMCVCVCVCFFIGTEIVY